jgi:hypothetical protein
MRVQAWVTRTTVHRSCDIVILIGFDGMFVYWRRPTTAIGVTPLTRIPHVTPHDGVTPITVAESPLQPVATETLVFLTAAWRR